MKDEVSDQIKVRETEKRQKEKEDSIEKFIEEMVDFAIKNLETAGYDDPKDEVRIIRLIDKRIAAKREKKLAEEHEKTETY